MERKEEAVFLIRKKLNNETLLTYKDIATITGVSINTALGRVRYAVMNLRRMAEEKNISLALEAV